MDAGWPALPFEEWQPTSATLHMCTQIVGKVRLAQSPYLNHWWQVPLYVSACGLTTTAVPCKDQNFEVEFDFIGHVLAIRKSDGTARTLPLAPQSVAAFYAEFMAALRSLGIDVGIWTMPVEIPEPIAFDKDTVHASYDPAYVARFWRGLPEIRRRADGCLAARGAARLLPTRPQPTSPTGTARTSSETRARTIRAMNEPVRAVSSAAPAW